MTVTGVSFHSRCNVIMKGSLIFLLFLCLKPKTSFGLKQQGQEFQLIRQSRETNPVNFVRLLFLRLIYGVATLMGFDEGLSDVANGAFVPPGVENDYGGFGFGDRESDDYSYNDDDNDDDDDDDDY